LVIVNRRIGSLLTRATILAEAAASTPRHGHHRARALLLADAAWRLGPRACLLAGWHRLSVRTGLAARRLGAATVPAGPLLPGSPPATRLPGDATALAAAADASVPASWHGPFAPDAPALGMDLFAAGDIRPVWEANRLLAMPLLALAARIAPTDGHLARAEALLRQWIDANPPFRGPAWACGQEAALRAMHLCLALALLDADRTPPAAMRALLAAHARRIAATRAYAAAQDNNHAISEPAGLFVIALVLGHDAPARRAARALAQAVARLVAPDGAFAQASPGYHRLLLDTLAVAEWFRRRHGAPAFAGPVADRMAAATAWLAQVMDPATGALPRCGAVDDSAFADLSLHGPADARGSVGRAAALWRGAAPGARREGWGGALPLPRPLPTKGLRPLETSFLALGAVGGALGWKPFLRADGAPCQALPVHPEGPPSRPAPRIGFQRPRAFGGVGSGEGQSPSPPPPPWRSEGWLGAATPRFRLLLRTGVPMRFRPAQADILHLDLALDGAPLLIDGGTGAYNPPPGRGWWMTALAGTAGHNTVQFDGQEQMPRLGRFLYAGWPRCRAVPGGAAMRDAAGRRHERRVALAGGTARIEDRVSGRFAHLVLRWRLAPGDWRVTADGAAGPRARLAMTADAPCRIRLARGWHSPAYGVVEPAPVLELAAAAPVSRLTTLVEAA
jgi:hypothetical protein